MNTEVSQGQREEVIKTAISKLASMMSVIYDIRDVAYWWVAWDKVSILLEVGLREQPIQLPCLPASL